MPIDLEMARHLIGWTCVDEAALAALRPVLQAHAAQVLEEFRAYLEQDPEVSVLWAKIGEEGRAQVNAIFREGLEDRIVFPPNESFLQWTLKTGRVPVELGVPPLYVVSVLEWLRGRLFELIRMELGPEGSAAAHALGKMFDLTIALVMEGSVMARGTMGGKANDRMTNSAISVSGQRSARSKATGKEANDE